MKPAKRPRIVFVFLDGVGLGPATDANPFAALRLPAFERLAGAQRWTADARALGTPTHTFHPIDANLGVEGLPQSGTGQATLFTGINCAEAAGRHYGPFPHSTSKPILAEHNLFVRLQRLGFEGLEPALFANAYPPRFFEMVKRRDRWTVTTRCCLDAGLTIRTVDDVRRGEALTAELTGQAWREQLGLAVDLLTEAEAGQRLAHLSRGFACTLFEYFLTDKAGHRQDPAWAADILHALDRFFAGLLGALDPTRDTLLVTSDHGNIEALDTKSHTRHPVPLVAYGPLAPHFRTVADLTGVTPALVAALTAAPLAAPAS